jgi:hypothetical protein
MTDWPTSRLATRDGATLDVALPPGWWTLCLTGADIAPQIAAAVDGRTADLPPQFGTEFTEELARLARVATTAGALLLAGGAAVAEDTGQLVSATLMIAPYELYGADDRPQWTRGPSSRQALPAGSAVRNTWMGVGPSPFGDVRQLDVEYVIAGHTPPTWVLAFRTPALGHVEELLQTFDGIAASLRVVPVSPASAFS